MASVVQPISGDEKIKDSYQKINNSLYGLEGKIDDPNIAYESTGRAIYVDAANGSDMNDGSAGNPFKTVTHALGTIRKNLHARDVKIRILPGDYRSEGSIVVNYFSGGRLVITAYDGVSDVDSINDNHVFAGFSVYDNSCTVVLSGIKVINPESNGYGIFVENTKYCHIIGYRNNDSTITTNSGIGVTRGSNVLIENSQCSNRSTVISCNHGSKVVSKNWIDSNGNNAGLVAQGGGDIRKIDPQPAANIPEQVFDGGSIFDEEGANIAYKKTYQTLVNRDLTDTGTFIISIDLSSPPTWIKVSACVSGGPLFAEGHYARGQSGCIYTTLAGERYSSYHFVEFLDGAGNSVAYDITSVTESEITLSRSAVGALSGTASLIVLCGV